MVSLFSSSMSWSSRTIASEGMRERFWVTRRCVRSRTCVCASVMKPAARPSSDRSSASMLERTGIKLNPNDVEVHPLDLRRCQRDLENVVFHEESRKKSAHEEWTDTVAFARRKQPGEEVAVTDLRLLAAEHPEDVEARQTSLERLEIVVVVESASSRRRSDVRRDMVAIAPTICITRTSHGSTLDGSRTPLNRRSPAGAQTPPVPCSAALGGGVGCGSASRCAPARRPARRCPRP